MFMLFKNKYFLIFKYIKFNINILYYILSKLCNKQYYYCKSFKILINENLN